MSVTDTKPTVSDSEGIYTIATWTDIQVCIFYGQFLPSGLVSDAEVGGITTGIAIPMLLLGFGLGVLFECSGLRKVTY